MSSGSSAGADNGRRIRVVSIVPHASDQEADCAVVRQPFHVLHRNRTALG